MDLPLESIHKQAFKAAEAAACAGDQGQYWEMHDQLFANQKALAPEQLRTYAVALQLDLSEFDSCLESSKHAKAVRKDMATARAAGLTSTPSFGIGFTDPKNLNKVKVIRTLRGAQPFSAFKSTLDGLLSQVKKPPPAGPQQ